MYAEYFLSTALIQKFVMHNPLDGGTSVGVLVQQTDVGFLHTDHKWLMREYHKEAKSLHYSTEPITTAKIQNKT